jgi:hypothetical protein
MAGRPKHPNKEIEAAVQYAESKGWTCKMSNGHAWGRILCPHRDRSGCMTGIWSTPKNREGHARSLIRFVDRCTHKKAKDGKV